MRLYKRHKLVYGVGINDADYNVQVSGHKEGKKTKVWICPYYNIWKHMLMRCYSEKYKLKRPTYEGCTVCDEWKLFSKFKAWMETQNYKGRQLDKDLLKVGNKVYCPEYCIFVDNMVNSFVTDSGATRGEWLLGASWHKRDGKFQSRCRNPFTNREEYLGSFLTELEAHLAWKARKHELACELADSDLVTDERLAEALRNRYK